MTDSNRGFITSGQKIAIKVVEEQSDENLRLIIKELNYNGIIIDNKEPSFHSSMAMKNWNPYCEDYLRKGREDIKDTYTGGKLYVGWTNEGNNYCLMDADKYTIEEGIEYMESVWRNS